MHTEMFTEMLLVTATNCDQSKYPSGGYCLNKPHQYCTTEQHTIPENKYGQYLCAAIKRPA